MRNEQLKVKEMSTPAIQLRLEVLIPEEKKVCTESIEFNKNIIANCKKDIENLKAINGFEKFVEYKRQAIKKMEKHISSLEKELIDLNVENDCLSIQLEKASITDFVCTEWKKLNDGDDGKDCFTKEIIDNKDTDKIIEVLKTRCYINHVYYQLAVERLQGCFDDEEQLIVPQEIANYYSDIVDLIVNVIDIDDMEYRLDCLL